MDTNDRPSDLVIAKRSFVNQDEYLPKPKDHYGSSSVKQRKPYDQQRQYTPEERYSSKKDDFRAHDLKNSGLHNNVRNQGAPIPPMGDFSNQLRRKKEANQFNEIKRPFPSHPSTRPVQQKPFKIDDGQIHESKLIEHRPSNYRAHNYKMVSHPVKGESIPQDSLPIQNHPRLRSKGNRNRSPIGSIGREFYQKRPSTGISGNLRITNNHKSIEKGAIPYNSKMLQPYYNLGRYQQSYKTPLIQWDYPHVDEWYQSRNRSPPINYPHLPYSNNMQTRRYLNFRYLPNQPLERGQRGMFSPVRHTDLWKAPTRGRHRLFSFQKY